MRSDARKQNDAMKRGFGVYSRTYSNKPTVDDILAPIVALAEAADRQFGSAQVITRDALWAAIAVARGEQS